MSYRGDIRLSETHDFKFSTTSFGVPTTLAGTPVISAYPGNSTTELTAGITLTVDIDGRTGYHNIRVVASTGNGYLTATDYDLVITTGTIAGSTAVGLTTCSFSIENRSAVMPTTIGRTLDVSAGGEAGLDWANVGSPTTSLALTGTTIATTQKVDIETIKTNPVVNGGTITFPTTATLASTTNITAGSMTTVGTLTTYTGNTPQTGDAFARLGAPAGASVSADVAAVKVDTAAVKVQTDKLAFTVPNQIDANVLDWKSSTAPAMTGDAFARLGAPAGASVSADVAAVKSDTAAVKTATNTGVAPGAAGGLFIAGTNAATAITTGLTAHLIGTVDTLTTYTGNTPQTGDGYALLNGTNTELSAVPASTVSLVTMIKWLFLLGRNKITQTATTQIVKANDGSTTVGTSTVSDDATTFTRGKFS